MRTFISSVLIIVGIVAMAGSGGDCDGKCGAGNDIATMLQIAGIGLAMFVTGTIIAIRGQQ